MMLFDFVAESENTTKMELVAVLKAILLSSFMTFSHHGINIELPDEWWAEAGMTGFVPASRAFLAIQSPRQQIREVCIEDVGPVLRSPMFRDGSDGEGSARQRVECILRGFRLDQKIPPVEVVKGPPEYGHRYKLVAGAHRFYCSLAAGFTHVPAVIGFDITAPEN